MKKFHAADRASDTPTPAQLKEFFSQIESGRITKHRLQDFLRPGQTAKQSNQLILKSSKLTLHNSYESIKMLKQVREITGTPVYYGIEIQDQAEIKVKSEQRNFPMKKGAPNARVIFYRINGRHPVTGKQFSKRIYIRCPEALSREIRVHVDDANEENLFIDFGESDNINASSAGKS